MENKNLISFIIPIYNVNIKYLQKCINSIENQTIILDYEVLLINDGSTIEEIEIYCKEQCLKNNNIKYIYQDNHGVSSARNTGIQISNGKYIFFVDADDEIKEDFFNKFLRLEFKNQQIIIFDYSFLYNCKEDNKKLGNTKQFLEDKKKMISNVLYNPHCYNNFMIGAVWGKCFLKEFLVKNNIRFKEELHNAEDRMFMLEAIDKAEKIEYIPINCYKYRLNIGSVSHNINLNVVKYYIDFYKYVQEFLYNSKYNSVEVRKYLEYSIINEILILSYFNINYTENYYKKRKKVIELFRIFDLNKSIKYIRYKEIKSIKGKIKLFCFKKRYILLLNIIFIKKQNAELKKIEKRNQKC